MSRSHILSFTALATVIAVTACQPKQRSSAVPGAELAGRPVDQARAQQGAALFRAKGCDMCHKFGGVRAAPDLAGVMERRDHDWLRKWLKETNAMLQSDPQAQDMLKQWKGYKMPQIKLSDAEIEALFHFMAQESARVRGSSSE